MKYIIIIFAAFVLYNSALAQQVASKVSFTAIDGKAYTGVVTEVQGDKYKIKYDGFDFDAWLTSNQFMVTENPPANNQTPALPGTISLPALPQTLPETTQHMPETIPETAPQTIPQTTPETGTQTTFETGTQTMPETGPLNTGNNPGGMTIEDSVKMAINNIKNAFGAVNKFFTPKRDTITIMIADIDYDNSNLALLKENLKKLKAVSSVLMHYKLSTAIIEIICKSKAPDLWDKVPLNAKQAFKILEANDNNIVLKYKLAQ
ncbi:MAG: hypothetical protein LH615_12245 [Ferruginibacter sp.]|nr:hypothetical protein [Ferruginibacter sp.]